MTALRIAFILSIAFAEIVIFSVVIQGSKNETDFPAFYSAALLYKAHANSYDINKQCEIQSTLRAGECLPFAHPPVLLPLIAAVSSPNFTASYWRWISILITVSLLCVGLIYSFRKDLSLALQSACFLPLLVGISQAQDTSFVLMSILLFILLRKHELLAGLCLSLSILKPQFALLLALPLFFYQRKMFFGFCLGCALWLLLTFLLVGVNGIAGLWNIAQSMATAGGLGLHRSKMPNVVGLLSWLNLDPRIGWAFFAIGLVVNCWLWRSKSYVSALAMAIIVALFVSPHTHIHDLALLLIPMTFAHRLAMPLIATIIMIGLILHVEPFLGLLLTVVCLALLQSQNMLAVGVGVPSRSRGRVLNAGAYDHFS
jgi:hypothetical protein